MRKEIKEIDLRTIWDAEYKKAYDKKDYPEVFNGPDLGPVTIAAMHEACRQALELAAENAEAIILRRLAADAHENIPGVVYSIPYAKVNKESITTTINQVKG